MWNYEAPLAHMRWVIAQVLKAPAQWAATPAFADLDEDTAAEVLEQAARFAAGVLLPLNAKGDQQGCRLEGRDVITPEGYPAAWAAFVEGGWPALACDPAVGGQGLPQLLNAALYEMLVACNHGWTMYPGLLHGAYETVKAHGSAELRERVLPKLVSGEWLAAMALTEPQAGSDLGLVRTKAEPRPDGTLAITGSKIFISGADHDMSENIVHLVLCRLPDAPPGTKGLSLALCSKFLPDGTRNAIHVDGLEHKMGIHGSATCVLRYEGATGWLVGEPGRGLQAMFLMMNAARLHVGLQGLGHLEMASQNARRQALERLQMRAAVRPTGAAPAAADPIAWHPAMRRTVRGLQSLAEGFRVLAYRTAMRIDAGENGDAAAHDEAALLTPIVKAFGTEWGFRGASEALQVWGGYGYVREAGIEQTLRDARIAMIYEGTNEIQAIDLLQRKVLGGLAPAFETLLQSLQADADGSPAGRALAQQVQAAREAAAVVRARSADPEAALAVADDFLAGCGWLLMAWAWCVSSRAAQQGGTPWHDERASLAQHGVDWWLPQAAVHWARVKAGAPLGAVEA